MSALLNHDAEIHVYRRTPLSHGGRPRKGVAPQQVQRIQSIVAHAYGLASRDSLLSRRRDTRILHPRQIALYLCRDLTPCSLPEIGRAFGIHHTTAFHSIRLIITRLAQDPELKAAVDKLRSAIQTGMEVPELVAKRDVMPEWARRLEAKLDRLLEVKP